MCEITVMPPRKNPNRAQSGGVSHSGYRYPPLGTGTSTPVPVPTGWYRNTAPSSGTNFLVPEPSLPNVSNSRLKLLFSCRQLTVPGASASHQNLPNPSVNIKYICAKVKPPTMPLQGVNAPYEHPVLYMRWVQQLLQTTLQNKGKTKGQKQSGG